MSIQVLKIPESFEDGTNQFYLTEGDTIPKLIFTAGLTDDIDFTTCTIKMQLYQVGVKYLDITNGNGITVVGAKSFEIDQIDHASNPFKEGIYIGDLEITDTNGFRLTYHRVQYTILKQYTT